MNALSVLAVCGDAGGAAAIAPVVARLEPDSVRSLVYGAAEPVFARHDLACETLPPDADANAILADLRPDALLTGTSVNDFEHEKRFHAAARRRGVPSVAVIDFWSNYRARFGAILPDRIAVIDRAMRVAMIADGFPAERLRVTGGPQFDALGAARRSFSAACRTALRASVGASEDDFLVLFASQPLHALYGDSLGFSERTVLPGLIEALPDGAILVVRPHPRESIDDYADLRSERVRIVVTAKGGGPREWVLSSDLVVGMTTELLVEAAVLGVPTVSVQPDARVPNPLPSGLGSLKTNSAANVVALLRFKESLC